MDCRDSILVRSVERLLQLFALLLRPYLDVTTTSGTRMIMKIKKRVKIGVNDLARKNTFATQC